MGQRRPMKGEIRKNNLLSAKYVINRSHGYSTNKKMQNKV
jgi:hypothetical protein